MTQSVGRSWEHLLRSGSAQKTPSRDGSLLPPAATKWASDSGLSSGAKAVRQGRIQTNALGLRRLVAPEKNTRPSFPVSVFFSYPVKLGD